MTNTRDFNSLGIWAADAVTPVPVTPPLKGVAYRDDALTESQNKAGEPFDTKPDSAEFNQKMFIITSFIDIIDKKGVPGWSNLVDYTVPALVWGFDGTPGTGNFFIALQESGPGTTPRDPISEPTYWEIVTSATQLRQDLADETPGAEGSKLVGYNKFDTNGGIDDGLTVKAALDELTSSSNNLNGLRLVMAGSFSGATGLAIGNTFNIYQNKAFIVPDPVEPSIVKYVVYIGEDPSSFGINLALSFVSTRATPNPLLPAGNFAASVPGTLKDSLPLIDNPSFSRDAIQLWQYTLDTNFSVTVQEDFDLVVFALGS